MSSDFIVGHVIGRASTLNASVDDVEAVVESDARLVVEKTYQFFDEFLPLLGVFVLIVLVFTCIGSVCVSCARWSMHRWAWAPNTSKLVQYAFIIVLGTLALVTAFSAVGFGVVHLLLGLGLIGIIFSSGCSRTIGEVSAGIELQFDSIAEHHTSIKIAALGVHGRIIAMNLLRVEIVPFVDVPPNPDTGFAGARVEATRTGHLPNTALRTYYVEYTWDEPRLRTLLTSEVALTRAEHAPADYEAICEAKRSVDATSERVASLYPIDDVAFIESNREKARRRFAAALV